MQGSDGGGALGANLDTTASDHICPTSIFEWRTLAACHHAAGWCRDQPAHKALNEAKFDQSRLVGFWNGFAHEAARHQHQRGIFRRRQVGGIWQPVHHTFQVGAGASLLQSDGAD